MDDAMRAASTVGIVGDPFEGKLGGFNEMPPNWTTITQSEFHWKFGMDSGRRLVFRQVMLPTARHGELTIDPKRVRWCNVYFWVNTDLGGVGWIEHYNGAATRSETDAFWPQYFKFAVCEHEFQTIVSRMCYWEGRCTKCGYVRVVDSSD